MRAVFISVEMYPGATAEEEEVRSVTEVPDRAEEKRKEDELALTLIPFPDQSFEKALVRPRIPCLAAA